MTNDHITRWRENHHKALETLRGPGCTKTGLQLWRALTRIERLASLNAVKLCNGEIEQYAYEVRRNMLAERVAMLFCKKLPGFFVNADPR